MKEMRRLIQTHEFVLFVLVALLCVAIGIKNPAFWSLGNVFDLLKSSVTLGLLALGVLVILISGDIDISFPAIAAFSMYVTCLIAGATGLGDHIAILFGMAAATGGLLGMFNAVFIHFFRLPALIVTLGTASLIRGGLLAFVGTRIITDLPESMVAFSRAQLFRQQLPGGETIGLAVSFFILIGVALLVQFLLKHTLLGRGIYALGGAPEAARRAGFNIRRIRFFIFGLVGCLAGVVGIIHASNMRNANPFDLSGLELTVIAAVVVGGADITGGKGTVIGTLLGTLLLVIIGNSLILLGLPTQWHKVAVGTIIIVSAGMAAWRRRMGRNSGRRK
jgi:simple sugar transport system permease protein